jgi:hypothetical protein
MGRPPSTLPDWLLRDLGPTLELAAVLAGSTPGAVDLAARALATGESWTATGERVEPYDLTPRLRAAVVRTFLSSPLGRSRPPAAAVGLDALTGPARAAVVLRDAERLTGGEIVSIMDRPGRRIADELAAIPAGAHDAEIADLAALAPDPSVVADRLAVTSRQLRSQRRTRTGLLTAAVLLLVAAVAVPTVIISRLPVGVRPEGQWRFSHDVRLPDGWKIRYRSITADTEVTGLALPWPAQQKADCTVTVMTPGQMPRSNGPTEPTSVDGRPGVLVDRPGNDLALFWQYADSAWAAVECPAAAATESLLRQIAGTVRFRDNRQLLPFTLTALPDQYRIRMVGFVDEAPDWGPFAVLDPPDNSYWPVLLIGPHTSEGEPTAGIERCLGPDDTICVTAAQSDDQVPVNLGVQRRVLSETVALMRVAPRPSEQSTWFDAIGLPSA